MRELKAQPVSWSKRTRSCVGRRPTLGQKTLSQERVYPLVTDLADEGIPVAVTCRVLGFSRQGYFKWRAKPVCDRDLSDAYLTNAALDDHHDDPTFGYRLPSPTSWGDAGFVASENRVQRLCSMQRIWSTHAKRAGPHASPGPGVHDDLVETPDFQRISGSTSCGSRT